MLVLRRADPTAALQLAETSARGECRIQTWANTVRKPLLLVGAATSTLPFRAELWSERLRIVRQRSGLRLMERGVGYFRDGVRGCTVTWAARQATNGPPGKKDSAVVKAGMGAGGACCTVVRR